MRVFILGVFFLMSPIYAFSYDSFLFNYNNPFQENPQTEMLRLQKCMAENQKKQMEYRNCLSECQQRKERYETSFCLCSQPIFKHCG